MKKLLLTAFAAISIISSVFASPVKGVNYFVLNSFQHQFKNVENVQWAVTPSYAKATFILNHVRTEAYYNLDGAFIGKCHAITLGDLPIAVKRSFAKKYADYVVKEAIQFDGVEETAYFISAQNEKQSVVFKVDQRTIWFYSVSNEN